MIVARAGGLETPSARSLRRATYPHQDMAELPSIDTQPKSLSTKTSVKKRHSVGQKRHSGSVRAHQKTQTEAFQYKKRIEELNEGISIVLFHKIIPIIVCAEYRPATLKDKRERAGKLWSKYTDETDKFDKVFVENLRGDTEGTLIFVCSLYSTISFSHVQHRPVFSPL
jgi:hypothetical protein